MQVGNVFSALAGAERVFAVLDAEPEAADASDAVSIAPIRGEVVLDHVTFGYEPGQVILKDISLYAKPGQKIAFVGSTGAGKTTITNLINRFYDIQGGSITVDGADVRRMHRKELRENIAMVLQDTHLLPARYGKIFDTGGWMPRMKKLLRRQKRHRRIPLSCVCRMGMTRCWRATVQT